MLKIILFSVFESFAVGQNDLPAHLGQITITKVKK